MNTGELFVGATIVTTWIPLTAFILWIKKDWMYSKIVGRCPECGSELRKLGGEYQGMVICDNHGRPW